MTIERFYELMKDEENQITVVFPKDKDNALSGLNLIAKYLPSKGIEAAEHDIIYSVSPEKLIEAGITEEDAIQLRTWNWMIDDDYLACFV